MELKHKKSNEFIYSLHKNVEEYLCHKCKKEEVCYSINDIQYAYESGWNEAMKNMWISSNDTLPELYKKVLVLLEYEGNIEIHDFVYEGGNFVYGVSKILAWMPIPSFDEMLEMNKDVSQI